MNLNTNIEHDIPRLVRTHNTKNTTIAATNNKKEIKKSLNIIGIIYIKLL